MNTNVNNSQKDLLNQKNNDLKEALKLSQKELTDKLNLFDFKDLKIKEKKSNDTKSKDDMYHYSFLFNKYQKRDYLKLDKTDFKKFGQQLRSKLRNKRDTFANNICLFAKNKDIVNLQNEIKLFNSFYKETYILNDYSIKSISSTNRDDSTNVLLSMMLNIILKLK